MNPTPVIDMFSGTGELAGAWEVGAPHRRERVMLFEPRHINVVRQVAPSRMLPTSSVVDRAWGLTPRQWDDVKRRYREKHRNGHGETCHWMMRLPYGGLDALGLSVSAQRHLAGNAVVRLQARLIAINNERNL